MARNGGGGRTVKLLGLTRCVGLKFLGLVAMKLDEANCLGFETGKRIAANLVFLGLAKVLDFALVFFLAPFLDFRARDLVEVLDLIPLFARKNGFFANGFARLNCEREK